MNGRDPSGRMTLGEQLYVAGFVANLVSLVFDYSKAREKTLGGEDSKKEWAFVALDMALLLIPYSGSVSGGRALVTSSGSIVSGIRAVPKEVLLNAGLVRLGGAAEIHAIDALFSNSNSANAGPSTSNNTSFSRNLTPDDMGIVGTIDELRGTFSVIDNEAKVRIDMIRGEIRNPFDIIKNLTSLAKAHGATILRIEGTIANERLYRVMERFGMVSNGPNDVITISIK